MVPLGALLGMLEGSTDGRQLGRAIGAGAIGRVAARLASRTAGGFARDQVRSAPLEQVVELLGGELAVLGLGSLHVERWGRAMLFVLEPCAIDERGDALLAGMLEGALTSVAGREVCALVVDRTSQLARVLVGSVGAMAKAEALHKRGAFFTEIVAALHDDARGRGGADRTGGR